MLALGSRFVRHADRPGEPLPIDASIASIFERSGSSLLIAGPPGSGKTTVLLELCDALLRRAAKRPDEPVPVVLSLASWARRREAVETWVTDELVRSYLIPRDLADRMTAGGRLTLLLGGLDEVPPPHRTACVKAINSWRARNGLVPVAVCSRTAELSELGARLRLDDAVELLPPTDAQVEFYLRQLENAGTPTGELRTSLRTDEDMRELLRSPLMLHVVALAYHGRKADDLRRPGTVTERRARLWAAYVARMLEQRPVPAGARYTGEQAVRWLGDLSGALERQNQNEFHLDRLTPAWLATLAHRRYAHRMIVAGGGIIAGAVGGATFALVKRAYGLQVGTLEGTAGGLVAGIASAALGALLIGLSGGLATNEPSRERVVWSWFRLRRGIATAVRDARAGAFRPALAFGAYAGATAAAVAGAIAGAAVASFSGLAVALGCGVSWAAMSLVAGGELDITVAPTEQLTWSWGKLRRGLPTAVGGGLVGGVIYGAGGAVAGGSDFAVAATVSAASSLMLAGVCFAGLSPTLREERFAPNEGIRRSARYAVAVGAGLGVSTGLLFALAGRLADDPPDYLLAGLGGGLPFGIASALIFGGAACIQHYLIRGWLVRERSAPWRYTAFLTAMNDRLLIRRSGSAFVFPHRLLREHFATLDHARHRPDSTSGAPNVTGTPGE
ncbi:hypothetical protein [Actinoplanes sp. NPDC023714]|uniref:NACHT domain-containing protein n=1 Tax=Actinoplanes sp. NPDC023714 TaxID=3154322 RepID=UPI00340DF858